MNVVMIETTRPCVLNFFFSPGAGCVTGVSSGDGDGGGGAAASLIGQPSVARFRSGTGKAGTSALSSGKPTLMPRPPG